MYHLSVKPISRASGRSITAAAAYRAGAEVIDQRTGEVHDYTRKRDVEFTEIVLPAGAPAWAMERSELWSAAELAEKRKDARVGREYEVAIPRDLTREQGIALVRAFALDLSERYGVAVEFSVHRDDPRAWDGTEKGFEGYHAHVLTSTRQLGADGFGGKATPEISDTERRKMGLGSGASEIERVREGWERLANQHLEQAGQDQRIDRRSLEDQGFEREPTRHLGPTVTALERRGLKTDLGDVNRRIEAGIVEDVQDRGALDALQPQLTDAQSTLAQAVRMRPQVEALTASLEAGADDFARRFEAEQQAKEAKERANERQRERADEVDQAKLNDALEVMSDLREHLASTLRPQLSDASLRATMAEYDASRAGGRLREVFDTRTVREEVVPWLIGLRKEMAAYVEETLEQARATLAASVEARDQHQERAPLLFGKARWRHECGTRQMQVERDEWRIKALQEGDWSKAPATPRSAALQRMEAKFPELVARAVAALRQIAAQLVSHVQRVHAREDQRERELQRAPSQSITPERQPRRGPSR
jgi:hypothetical protein